MGHAATQSQSQHFHAAVCSWELTLIKCPRACPHLRSCQRNHVRTLILGQEIVIVVYAWVQPDLLEPAHEAWKYRGIVIIVFQSRPVQASAQLGGLSHTTTGRPCLHGCRHCPTEARHA
eukprot:349719-Chlamydomonas_euryale.AAC.4